MNASLHQIHLILERPYDTEARWGEAPIVVACGVSVVHLDLDARPVAPGDAVALSVQWLNGPVPRVAILSNEHRALVNGRLAPHIAVVRGGDEIGLAETRDWRLHVAVFQAAPIGEGGDELQGRECPVCLTRFGPKTRIFRCVCGTALHIAEDGCADAPDCAGAVKACPDCHSAIDRTGGYQTLPTGFHGIDLLQNHRAGGAVAVR